MYILNVKI